METIIIGDKDCPFSDVIKIFQNSPTWSVAAEKWRDFARYLDVPDDKVDKYQKDMLADQMYKIDVFDKMLRDWRLRNAKGATLANLCKITSELSWIEIEGSLATLVKPKRQSDISQNPQSSQQSTKNASSNKFDKPPSYWTKFIQENPQQILVISSDDCELTCQRIFETGEKICNHEMKIFNPDQFAEFLSTCKENNEANVHPIVNCSDYMLIIQLAKSYEKAKITCVTSQQISEKKVFQDLTSKNLNPKMVKLTTELIQWNELTPKFQLDIVTSLETKLQIEASELYAAIENIDHKSLALMINGEIPDPYNLFKETIPEVLSHYIPRTLISRNVITKDIFKNTQSDIFLFKGIERYVLSSMTSVKGTDTSSNILQPDNNQLTTNFIILDSDHHFNDICDKFQDPIHIIQYSDEKFIWIKSRGHISSIQKAIAKDQSTISDFEFLKEIQNSGENTRHHMCISDTAGMGKSVLLGQVVRSLQKQSKEYIVAFISIVDMVQNIQQESKSSNINISTATQAVLSNYLCKSELGKLYLDKNKHFLRELCLDGFDEIDADDMDFTYKVLKTLFATFQNTRIWITTRPHMLTELEQFLQVLGSNIAPFRQKDKVNFLKIFWSKQESLNDEEALADFADKCLNSVRQPLDSEVEDITGIPLQCRLIGEIYEKEAQLFLSQWKDDPQILTNVSFNMLPLSQLYNKFVNQKFDQFYKRQNDINFTHSDLKRAHILWSLRLLYPYFAQYFEHEFGQITLSTQEIFDVGIIEGQSIFFQPRFIHRTFAEYFTALFVVDSLSKNSNRQMTYHLCHRIFETSAKRHFFGTYYTSVFELTHYKLKLEVICHFINDQLKTSEPSVDFNSQLDWTPETLKQVAEACAYHNFKNIFEKLVLPSAQSPSYRQTVFSDNLLFVATFAGVPLMKIIFENYKSHNNKPLTTISPQQEGGEQAYLTLLYFAVQLGKFATTEYILNQENFLDLVREGNSPLFSDLIYRCLCDTEQDDDRKIIERKNIINRLVQLNKDLLINSNYLSGYRFTIIADSPHVELIIELFKCAKDLYMKRNLLTRILHNIASQFKSSNFLQILESVFSSLDQDLITYICCKKYQKRTLIHKVLNYTKPDTCLLEFMKKWDPNFNSNLPDLLDLYSASLFAANSPECLYWLLNSLTSTDHAKLYKLFCISMEICRLEESVYLLRYMSIHTQIKISDYPLLLTYHFTNYHDNSKCDEYLKLAYDLLTYVIDESRVSINLSCIKDKLEKNEDEIETVFQLFDSFQTHNKMSAVECSFLKLKWLIACSKSYKPARFDKNTLLQQFSQISKNEVVDFNGNTILHIAAQLGSEYLLKFGIEMGLNINAKNEKKGTPLHLTVSSSDPVDFEGAGIKIFKLLIEHGANLLDLNCHNQTPICLLVSICKDVDKYDDYYDEKVYYLTINKRLDTILFILNKHATNQKQIDEIICVIVKSANLNIAREVCDWYIQFVKKPLNMLRAELMGKMCTLLDAALLNCDGEVLEYILETLGCKHVLQPIDKLCIHKCIEACGLSDFSKNKFIKIAVTNFETIWDSINTENDKGLAPLSLQGMTALIVETLVNLGADINIADRFGDTPLHWAVKQESRYSSELIDKLISCGANVYLKNSKNETAFDLLLSIQDDFDMKDCIKVFINHKFDLSLKSYSAGNSFLHLLPAHIFNPNHYYELLDCLNKNSYSLSALLQLRNDDGLTPVQIAQKYFPFTRKVRDLLVSQGIDFSINE